MAHLNLISYLFFLNSIDLKILRNDVIATYLGLFLYPLIPQHYSLTLFISA